MRRLPIFFLVDISESMAGENLYKLEEGMSAIASTLRRDPYALETAYISVVIFAGKARTIMPITELVSFHPPELPVAGGTALGNALNHLMDEIDRTVISNTPDRKGDWKPIIFLLTDGHSTDDTTSALQRWNSRYRNKTNLVAVSIGGTADHNLLKQMTENVVVFNDAAPDAFGRFVKWISMSIQSQSRSVQAGDDGRVNLAKSEPGLLENVEKASGLTPYSGVDDRFAVFIGKCEKINLPYVIKYELHLGRIGTSDPALAKLFETRRYALNCAVPVKNSYFELSDGAASGQSVNSEDLIGQPSCPHCNAQYGMAICSCGQIHCIDGGGEHSCPWCGKTGHYGSSGEGGGFNIGRGRG